jgi:hypothetical protein
MNMIDFKEDIRMVRYRWSGEIKPTMYSDFVTNKGEIDKACTRRREIELSFRTIYYVEYKIGQHGLEFAATLVTQHAIPKLEPGVSVSVDNGERCSNSLKNRSDRSREVINGGAKVYIG